MSQKLALVVKTEAVTACERQTEAGGVRAAGEEVISCPSAVASERSLKNCLQNTERFGPGSVTWSDSGFRSATDPAKPLINLLIQSLINLLKLLSHCIELLSQLQPSLHTQHAAGSPKKKFKHITDYLIFNLRQCSTDACRANTELTRAMHIHTLSAVPF